MKAETKANFTRVLLWSPRLLGFGESLYLGKFALAACVGEQPMTDKIADFLVHLTPSLLVLLTVLLSWRRFWIGALVFTGLAVYYALTTLHRMDWVLAISTPLIGIGLLYALNWWRGKNEQLTVTNEE
jgi:hypothetical protein